MAGNGGVNMELNRRSFLSRGTAFAAALGFSGLRAAKAVGLARGTAKLRFGVVSDVHLSAAGVKSFGCGDTTLLEKAFRHFREQGADAVMIAGDMADWGLIEQLELVAQTWNKVFPENKGLDGKPVEKLFVYGNHDRDGQYGYQKRYNLPESLFAPERRISSDPGGVWARVFGEPWEPMMLKDVKGYKFVLCQELEYPGKGAYADFLERHRAELEGTKPFFYTQHFHPRGTTCAPWTWGQDRGYSTQALSKFPNAVAFSGHSHVSLVDDRVVWQGGFTSVGTASLRYLISLGGRENSSPFGVRDLQEKQMANLGGMSGQHGEFVTVYDDCITIERRDFTHDLPVGADWVIPLAYDGSLTFAARAAKAAVPQFAAGSKVVLTEAKGMNRAKQETDQVTVSFPNVRDGVRAFDFEVVVEAVDVDVEKVWMTKRVYSPRFFAAPSKDVPEVSCVFAKSELPPPYLQGRGKGVKVTSQAGMKYRFAVRPCNCWGKKGEAIYTDWQE